MILLICSILLLVCVVKWIYRDKTLYDFADQIPGPKSFPIIGSSHKLLKQSEEERFKIVQNMLVKYECNDMTRFWLGPVLFIFINKPDLIKEVLNSPDCLEKSFTYKFLRLDKGLLAAKRDTWVDHRQFLEESFKLDILKGFISIFVDSSNQMVKSLGEENESKIDVFKSTSRCALTMVLATSFGIKSSEVHFDDEILKAVEELIKIISLRCHEPVLYIEPLYRMTRTYYREKKYRKRCCYYLDQVLKERRELIAPNNNNNLLSASSTATMATDITSCQRDEEMGIESDDSNTSSAKNFIDHMILHNNEFTDEEIHDHIYTFVAAGYETVALQTFFTLLLLAMHTDIQDKVFSEISTISSDINYESLSKLKYLEMVIKESMRLLPSLPIIGRETQEEMQIGELKVPKGITLLIHLFNLHRRKEIWGEDAHQFNPDRFLPENSAKRHSHAFLPFSEGLRDCIGKVYAMLAIKTILATFLRKFKVTTDLKVEDLTYKADITLKICQDVKMNVVKR